MRVRQLEDLKDHSEDDGRREVYTVYRRLAVDSIGAVTGIMFVSQPRDGAKA
jgi:hypothetical protein